MFDKLKEMFNNKEFEDVTLKRPETVANLKKVLTEDSIASIFERKNSVIVYTVDKSIKHVSISNKYREVKDWEIAYALKNIMKLSEKEIKAFKSANGIVHLHSIE